jgi:hypothetical protein
VVSKLRHIVFLTLSLLAASGNLCASYVVQKDEDSGATKVTKVEGGGLGAGLNTAVAKEDADIIKKALKALKQEYDASYTQIENTVATNRTTADRVLDENHRTYLAQASTSGTLIVTDASAVQSEAEDSDPEVNYKKSEYAYNVATVTLLFADDARNREGYRLIASGLIINGKNLSTFLSEARQQQMTEANQILAVKDALKTELKRIIDLYLYEK